MQRISCGPCQIGQPAIEGWHQDGKEMVGILCLARHNITGGISKLKISIDQPEIMSETLQPEEMIIFDDKKVFHYATPIEPKNSNGNGHRDVLLISTPSSRLNVSEKV
ncbi:hypothetical protein AB835_11125 [Candidatus Endobugula sertula]|uniref:2OG-Fe dioxygenase family protein n=1 Tax=Candidatus Endobugula sertula TaxID=62101 RepID=A0A1D2QN39_9GAMM|nr:hypothetical protein AB835_11125 [Candidatus Endobugula sertula]